MASVESVPVSSLEKLAAEEVAKQTLTQLDAKAAVRLLKEADKLHDVLWSVARHDLPTFLAALPKPKESLWIRDICQWFYLSWSDINLMWAIHAYEPRTIRLYAKSLPGGRRVEPFSTIDEVKSDLVPMLEQRGVREEAIAELILGAADYFTREAGQDNRWMPHGNVLGRRQEAAQLSQSP
jgi:hypothetical protein